MRIGPVHSLRPLVSAGLVFGAVLVALAGRQSAVACEPAACVGGYLVPAEGTVPASLQDLLWIPRQGDGTFEIVDADDVELRRLDDDVGIVVPVTVRDRIDGGILIRPGWPLEAGQAYELRGRDFCEGAGTFDDTPTVAAFEAGPAIPFPGSLGTVSVSPIESGSLQLAGSAACTAEVPAVWVDVRVEPSGEAAEWMDALLFETRVNDGPWRPAASAAAEHAPGASWMGRGRDRLFVVCEDEEVVADAGLMEGTHRVRFRAGLADAAALLATPEVEVHLSCDAAGETPGPGGGTGDSGGVPDGGDATPRTGCSATAGGSDRAVAGAALLLLGAAGWGRSRRRNFPLGRRRAAG